MKRATWIIIGLAAVFSLLAVAAALMHGGSSLDKAAELEKVTITGEYSVDGGEWLPLAGNTAFDSDREHTVKARGSLSREAAANETVILRVNNLLLSVRLNGREIYDLASGEDELTRTPGNGWVSFSSPGISASDTLEITVSNVYDEGSADVFADLFGGIYIGSEAALLA